VSVKIMSAIFDSKTLGPTERLVMLALADHADDQGRCYPSNSRLCDRTGLSERAVRQNIRALESGGFLSVQIGAGQAGANVYIVRPQGGQEMPPAGNAPGTPCRSGGHLVPDRGAADAPKPSGTIKEPSDISKTREAAALLEAWAGPEAVASFIAYRRKSKGKALTLTASKRLAENLKAIFQAGGNPDDALGMAEERGWLTIEPDWYFNAKGKHHGNRPSAPDNPTLRAIARAASAFEASPVDWPAGRSLA
jgi:hypothetical protein